MTTVHSQGSQVYNSQLMNTVKQTVLAAEQAAQAATVTPITVT